ncbi:MAG: hypothetical protein ACQESR_27660, partial [Planctomycetota bacterium]
DVENIWTVLGHGDDHATISSRVGKTVILDGGPGNDHLKGGGGSNILLGGLGDDMLIGGAVRDILIGGGGADRLVANPGQDLLIGDGTTYDSGPEVGPLANDDALLDLLAAWNGPEPFQERVAGLQDLVDSILQEDDADDLLTGASGEDWFVTRGGDTVTENSSPGNNGRGKGKGKKRAPVE